MVKIEPVAAFVDCSEAGSGIVNPRQRHPVGAGIGGRSSGLRRASFGITEQDGGTLAFREDGGRKQRAVTQGNGGGHRNAFAIQISEKRGFRGNIGFTARASR